MKRKKSKQMKVQIIYGSRAFEYSKKLSHWLCPRPSFHKERQIQKQQQHFDRILWKKFRQYLTILCFFLSTDRFWLAKFLFFCFFIWFHRKNYHIYPIIYQTFHRSHEKKHFHDHSPLFYSNQLQIQVRSTFNVLKCVNIF